MDATSIYLGRKLREAIALKRDEMLRPLLNGACADYSDYKNRTGYLKALADVEEMIGAISMQEDRRIYGAFGTDDDRAHARPDQGYR